MEKGILRKRLKGLLALSLAFYLMFGNGIQVLAAEYDEYDINALNNDDRIYAGSKIKYYQAIYQSGDSIKVKKQNGIKIDGVEKIAQKNEDGDYPTKEAFFEVESNLIVIQGITSPYGEIQLKTIYNIKVQPSSTLGGSTTGGRDYVNGDPVTVTATPNTGYKFIGWQESGQTVSEDSSYTFTVSGDRNLVAVFDEEKADQGNGTVTNPDNPNPGNTPQNPPTDPNGNQQAAKASSGGTHTHSLRWEIVQEPTETVDGRSEYRCECGHVEAAQPISFFGAIIKRIIKSIEEAPQNGTVVVENKFLRCLTDEIMEALHKRSDVNLEVKFSEQGVNYHFLIPATAAPTEEEEWFGYFYLGGRYGWLQ
ncbi:MAG: hypothetical protein IKL51_01840 [Lachnospiraceae bacterium]|nr:hypothetical protein [Lachnospiraceae bacterium]